MEDASLARLWRAAAEGLPVPLDSIDRVTSKTLASKLVIVAIWNDHGETVTTLLELLASVIGHPCELDVGEPPHGYWPCYFSPLAYAARYGSCHAARSLLEVQPDAMLDDGILSLAADLGHVEIVRLLADAKAQLDVADAIISGPLSHAVMAGRSDVVLLLLERKAEVHAVDAEGYMPLSYATMDGDTATVRLLLEARAHVNFVNPDPRRDNDQTALTCAASKGHLATASVLVEARAAINAVDGRGRTPLFYAAAEGNMAMAELLLGAKADVHTAQHDPPLQIATTRGHADMVQLLHGACIL